MNFSPGDSAEVRIGVEVGGRSIDLEAAAASGLVRKEPGARIEDVLRSEGGLDAIESQLTERAIATMEEAGVSPASIRLRAPVLAPAKVIGIGLNYRDHAREVKMDEPDEPILFGMYPNTIIGPDVPIRIPRLSRRIDYEAELAIVIGRRGRYISEADAVAHIAGYTVLNDVSARDLQKKDNQWIRGKCFDGFCPTGPYLVSPRTLGDGSGLGIRTRLNGRTMQDSNTRNLIFGVPRLVSFISEVMTLEPGDIIATGTPGGVGVGRKPPVWMAPGDIVEVEIDGIGTLRNPIAAEETG